MIDTEGEAAFADFRKKDSVWYHGDTYLFVYDLKANVLLNPAFPQREGTNVDGQKNANGRLFHNAMIEVAKTKGSGWVDYMFPKPKGRPNRLGNGLREEGDCGRSSWLGKRRAGLEEYVASSIVATKARNHSRVA